MANEPNQGLEPPEPPSPRCLHTQPEKAVPLCTGPWAGAGAGFSWHLLDRAWPLPCAQAGDQPLPWSNSWAQTPGRR